MTGANGFENGQENGLLIGEGAKPLSKTGEFASFLYNRKKNEFCGRTPTSWFFITVFYIFFYTALGAFWLGCLLLFLSTRSVKEPTFIGEGTIRGIHPGVGYQPWLEENPDSTLIKFNIRDETTWRPYVERLNQLMQRYTDTKDSRKCKEKDSNSEYLEYIDIPACRFDLSEIEKSECTYNASFGYATGTPCVAISLNKLINWKPGVYRKGAVPWKIRDRYVDGNVVIHCDGLYPEDKEHIGRITYAPKAGLSKIHFPYYYSPMYPKFQQPVAMIKFESLPINKIVMVECIAYAPNIEIDRNQKLGIVHFEILMHDTIRGRVWKPRPDDDEDDDSENSSAANDSASADDTTQQSKNRK